MPLALPSPPNPPKPAALIFQSGGILTSVHVRSIKPTQKAAWNFKPDKLHCQVAMSGDHEASLPGAVAMDINRIVYVSCKC